MPKTSNNIRDEQGRAIGGPRDRRPKEERKPEDGTAALGRLQCCADSKRSKSRCVNAPVRHRLGGKPIRYCRMHGGSADAGRPVEHGLNSKKLGRLYDAFEFNRQREDLLDYRTPLAFIDTTLETLAERATRGGDCPGWREAMLDLCKDALSDLRAGEHAMALPKFEELLGLIREGWEIDRALTESAKLAERRGYLAAKYREIELKEAGTVTRAELVAIHLAYCSLAERHAGPEIGAEIIDSLESAIAARSAGAALRELHVEAQGVHGVSRAS